MAISASREPRSAGQNLTDPASDDDAIVAPQKQMGAVRVPMFSDLVRSVTYGERDEIWFRELAIRIAALEGKMERLGAEQSRYQQRLSELGFRNLLWAGVMQISLLTLVGVVLALPFRVMQAAGGETLDALCRPDRHRRRARRGLVDVMALDEEHTDGSRRGTSPPDYMLDQKFAWVVGFQVTTLAAIVATLLAR